MTYSDENKTSRLNNNLFPIVGKIKRRAMCMRPACRHLEELSQVPGLLRRPFGFLFVRNLKACENLKLVTETGTEEK
jgi:hypothetical protein